MNKRKTTILIVFIASILTIIYTLASTYAVIIEVKEEDGIKEIVNEITIRDLVTDENGVYNQYYYDIKKELDITDEEATLLIISEPLNENLKEVLTSIVDYNLNNNNNSKLSNNELYELIENGLNNTGNLSENLKIKVLNKSNEYIQDVSEFLYDIDVKLIGG